MNTKNKPIGRTVGRQLVAELPAGRAPDEVVVDADNRLRRIEPGAKANKVTTLSLWAAAAQNIQISLCDPAMDLQFMQGATLGFQLFGLRLGADPMMPRASRPLNAEAIPGASHAVIENLDFIADELPTVLHNIDLDSVRGDSKRLDYVRRFRREVALFDQSLAAVQTQVENRLAPVLDSIHERGKSVINSHLVLRDRLEPLVAFCVGPALEAADSRKEQEQAFQRGVEVGRAQAAADKAADKARPAADQPEPAADQPKPAVVSSRKRG